MEMDVVQELQGHSDRVWSVAWRPDSGISGRPSMLASCSGDKTVRIWQCSSSQDLFIQHWSCVAVLDGMHQRTVRSCEWSPDGKLLATASFDGTTAIWENVGGDFECVASLEAWIEDKDREDWVCAQTLSDSWGHTSTVWTVSFDASGHRLVSCSDDLSLKIWDSHSNLLSEGNLWKHLCTISGYHDRTIFSVHWSKASGLIATGAGDDCIRIFSEESNEKSTLGGDLTYKMVLKKEKAHITDVNCVRWHPQEASLLASAGDDGVVKIWKVAGESLY